jgi:hypothetical protein
MHRRDALIVKPHTTEESIKRSGTELDTTLGYSDLEIHSNICALARDSLGIIDRERSKRLTDVGLRGRTIRQVEL